MEFSSVVFWLRFLPLFFIAYYVVPKKLKNVVLLLGSFCFYAWGKPLYLIPMLLSSCLDFTYGILIEKHKGKASSKILLAAAIFFDLTLMLFFGYADFFIETINLFGGTQLEPIGFPPPVGITIYTLQTMSYVIDVYRGKCAARRNLLDYCTYVSMFPQLCAGPVLRYGDVKDSLKDRELKLHEISRGAKRICVGLLKYVLIADVAGRLWARILEMRPVGMSTATAWLGLLAYAFRIYYALSGGADIAIGLGECLGFHFPENFDHPYVARSITDFIRRWNVSLSKWMKEYFYVPIAGKKKGIFQKIFWLLVTWGLIGLWYGPDWTFVLWGFWIGLFYVLEKLFFGKVLSVFPYVIGWAYTMLVVSVGWILLALNDLTDVWSYFRALFGAGGHGLIDRGFFFLVMENLPILALGLLCSTPILSGTIKSLEKGRNGMAIALTRIFEKVYPPVCLMAALTYLLGKGL